VLHLKRLYHLLHALKGLLSNWQQRNLPDVMTVDGLLSTLGGKLEEINFLEIQSYLRKSKVWHSLSIVPLRVNLLMSSARKENHNVHAKDESKSREKRSVETDSDIVDHLTKKLNSERHRRLL
jgi:hypothetical protein